MYWIFIVIVAHLFYAGVFILDRYLLKKEFSHPLHYAFWSGLLGVVVFALAPLGLKIAGLNEILFGLSAGVVWMVALIAFYTALHKGETSRVVPTVGSFIPIFTLVFSFFFLGERLSAQELIAFCLLVSGGVLLSFLVTKSGIFSNGRHWGLSKAFIPAISASLIFAIYFVMTKAVFLQQNYVSGLIWIRSGSTLGALLLLAIPMVRKNVFKKAIKIEKKVASIFISTKALGVIAGLLLYWAIYLGSVTLVNALKGTQYLFIMILAFIFFRNLPSLKEGFTKHNLTQKIAAIILIAAGLVILVI